MSEILFYWGLSLVFIRVLWRWAIGATLRGGLWVYYYGEKDRAFNDTQVKKTIYQFTSYNQMEMFIKVRRFGRNRLRL
jgi:hypothetical protein